jgi:hypothetical protein
VAGIYNRATYAGPMRDALLVWDNYLRSIISGGERKIVHFPQSEIA